jgi:LmbE family N-acetylglucosaminyl deacetylase
MEFAKEAGFTEREKYAEARKQECLSALALANVSDKRVVNLDVVDRCAPNCLAELTRKVANFLQYSAADIVLTHPYEGGHPDHDATAFATHAAVRLIRKNGFRPPSLFEMALHPSVEGPAKLPEFLPGADGEMTTLLLDPRSLELKKKMFACFKSQQESLKVSPFGPERFRQPADYDFSSPARSGKLHYENFDWAISGDEWQSLAREALAELFPAANNQAEAHA